MGDPALIGVVIHDSTTVAFIAVSDGGCLSESRKHNTGYIYGVLETLFNVHPLFATSTCCWREAEPDDIPKWKDSCYPTVFVW
jgi:hypothetical protein